MLFILQPTHSTSLQCVSVEINNTAKQTNADSNDATEMEFGLLRGGADSEHTSVGFVDISKTYVMQDAIFFGMESFDKVQQQPLAAF